MECVSSGALFNNVICFIFRQVWHRSQASVWHRFLPGLHAGGVKGTGSEQHGQEGETRQQTNGGCASEWHVALTTPPGNSRRPLLPIPTSVPSLLLYLPFQPLSSAVGPFPPSVRVLSATLCGSSRGSETVPRSLGLDGWRLPNTMNYVFPCASHTAFQ